MVLFWWIWTLGLLGILTSQVRATRSRLLLVVTVLIGITCLRTWLMPLERHIFAGHEAEYLRLFLGEMLPNAGNTASYPTMQIWWWIWGQIFAFWPQAPLWISSAVGVASLLLVDDALQSIFQLKRDRWIRQLWLFSFPLHWMWSLSAYNVIIPFFFVSLAFWLLARRRSEWVIGAALALAVSTRMEMIIVLLPFLYWKVARDGWATRVLWMLLLPSISLLAMMYATIPGEGERWLALRINWRLLVYHSPYHLLWPIVLLGAWLSKKTHLQWTLGALFLVSLNHVVMATFDDYASRHTLVSLLAFGIVLDSLLRHWQVKGLVLVVVVGHVVQWWQLRERWYAEAEQFAVYLSEQYPDLPVRTLSEAQSQGCAWINEEETFAGRPVRSHFNLLQPTEVLDMRREHSCIDWCLGIQDWGWSSLGISDRTVRLKAMFELEEVGIVEEEEAHCVQFRVGKRRFAIN